MKRTLSLLLTVAALVGCTSDAERDAEKDVELPESLTLVGKHFIPRTWNYPSKCYMYFSKTDNTNKVDVVAVKVCDCLTAQARAFELKIGDKKTISEWRKQMSHQGEEGCHQGMSRIYSQEVHRFTWERVKE